MGKMKLTLEESILIERLEQAATESQTTAEELLHTAVNEYLEKIAHQKIHAESAAFKAKHAELVTKYLDQYVAVHQGQVVDHDADARELYLRIRKNYGHVAVLIRRVTESAERELVFRSPRISKVRP